MTPTLMKISKKEISLTKKSEIIISIILMIYESTEEKQGLENTTSFQKQLIILYKRMPPKQLTELGR